MGRSNLANNVTNQIRLSDTFLEVGTDHSGWFEGWYIRHEFFLNSTSFPLVSTMVSRLCNELLSRIFLFSLEKRDNYFIEASSRFAPLSVRTVDRRWHYVAMNTPELWNSISIRRRVRPPHGYNFEKDANVAYEWLGNSRGLPSSIQLCYGDIKDFGKRLLWTDLQQTISACLSEESTCERLYIRMPDECTEKILWNLQTYTLQVKSLRSLALRSTREELLKKRYVAWWKSDHENENYPRYCHILDVQGLPSLEELEVHYPGPILFDGTSSTTTQLTMSLYKFRQLNESITESFPNLRLLTLDLRESLQLLWPPPTDWVVLTFKKLHTLEIRSCLHGRRGKLVFEEFFERVRFPQIKSLQIRNVLEYESGMRIASIVTLCKEFGRLEDVEIIDFLIKPADGSTIRSMLAQMPKLRTLTYREVLLRGSSAALASGLLTILQSMTAAGTAPVLECLAIDTSDLRAMKASSQSLVLRLICFLGTWREASEKKLKERWKGQIYQSPVRTLLLPRGTSELLYAHGASAVCGDLRFDWIADAKPLVMEDDLNDGDDSCCEPKFLSPINAEEMIVINGKAIPARLAQKFESRQSSSNIDIFCQSNEGSIQEVEHPVSGGLGWTDSLAEVEMLL